MGNQKKCCTICELGLTWAIIPARYFDVLRHKDYNLCQVERISIKMSLITLWCCRWNHGSVLGSSNLLLASMNTVRFCFKMVSFHRHPLYSPFCKWRHIPLILFGLFLHFGLDFYFIFSQFGHLLALAVTWPRQTMEGEGDHVIICDLRDVWSQLLLLLMLCRTLWGKH